MLSSKVSHVDSKMGDREGATHRQAAMEQTVKKVTHEVVRRIAGFEHSFVVEPRFDRIYEMVILIYKKYRTQLERMVSSLTLCDVDTAAASFDRVLDSLFVGGHINCGRVVTVLAFAGCVAQRCLQDRVIASTADVDQLAEVMGRQLAARLVQCRYSLVHRTHIYYHSVASWVLEVNYVLPRTFTAVV